ncbi:peptidoglycan-associated lipoprotein [Rickettsiella grylli]|nr:peptidoglycan-associated lipoprotein [Rickettsiella grylli]
MKRCLRMSVMVAMLLSLGACATPDPDNNEFDEANTVSTKTDSVLQTDSALTQGIEDDGFYHDENRHPLHVGDQTYHFDFNQSFVREEDKPSLQIQAHYLISHPQTKILIVGNTDERGSREYNIGLGQRRALSVERFLIANGVSKKQILTVSYGAEKPVAFGHSEADYAKNRRADLQYQTPVITDVN